MHDRNEAWSEEPAIEESEDSIETSLRPGASFLDTFIDWARALFLAFALFLTVRAVGVEAFKIPTSSMEGTLLVGDFLLVNKALYGAEIPGTGFRLPPVREPRRGDVIVFNPPHDPDRNYVKRLVGLPGDTLEMRGKQLVVNGEEIDEPYVHFIDPSGDTFHDSMEWQENHLVASPKREYHPSRDSWGPIVVPGRSYFVLGDNRDNSEDSRYWGFVKREAIRGQPWRVYYSFRPDPDLPMDWAKSVRWDRVGHRIQ